MTGEVPEESLTDAEFRTRILSAYQKGGLAAPRNVWFRGSFTDGTRYLVENGARGLSFYLVTDLTAPERIVGSISVTIPANATLGTATGPISLADPVINYKVFTTVTDSQSNLWGAKARLSSQTLLQVQAFRPVNNVTASATGVTVGAGDLIDIDVTASNPHGNDTVGLFGHGHTTTGHPVTDPNHTHNVQSNAGQVVVNVDYLIWHI